MKVKFCDLKVNYMSIKDEVNKILQLSKVLTPPFKPDNEWFEEEKDQYGRKIIKNKRHFKCRME